MKKVEQQRDALLAKTIDAAAERGLDDFSLRHLASLAGTSTTAIFQNFSGKAELLEHAMTLAIARDRQFHDALREESAPLVNSHIGFADFLACYVKLRPARVHARFASEIFLRLEDYPQCRALVADWHELRTAFWVDILARLDAPAGLAQIVSQFVLMEEFYAYALHEQCTYAMLLAETCRALCETALRKGDIGALRSDVSLTLDTQPLAMHETGDVPDSPVPEQLLDEALRIVEQSGLEALNQRRIAKNIGVSTSAIAYYFSDMKSFRNRVIWRALVRGIPSQLDPERPATEQPSTLSRWLEILDPMLQPGFDEKRPGFYFTFARLTGQACLMSLHDTSLVPLIAYLRALEGWGTYHVSRNIETLAGAIGREHATAFGVWVKAEALLRRLDPSPEATRLDRLEAAAELFLPSRKSGTSGQISAMRR